MCWHHGLMVRFRPLIEQRSTRTTTLFIQMSRLLMSRLLMNWLHIFIRPEVLWRQRTRTPDRGSGVTLPLLGHHIREPDPLPLLGHQIHALALWDALRIVRDISRSGLSEFRLVAALTRIARHYGQRRRQIWRRVRHIWFGTLILDGSWKYDRRFKRLRRVEEKLLKSRLEDIVLWRSWN